MLLCLLLAQGLMADTPRPLDFHYTEVVLVDNAYFLNASLSGDAPQRVEELVQAGVVIPFVAEFVLSRPRWYWFDEVIVERALDIKLSYHALTRQYRLSTGGLYRSFSSFPQAFAALRALRNWQVAERTQLTPGESYNAAVRLRLDMAQLPKPFQVAAIGKKDLAVMTPWSRWTFLAGPR
ncbi:MAG: DUF4390 domain-containing protein [Rhodocyclaceae bacterium]